MSKILQSVPYPTYSIIERDALTGVLKNYKINNSTTGVVEEWDGDSWKAIEELSYTSELSIIDGVATIDLSVSRSYGLVQLSSPTEIDVNLLTRKDQRTATLALYPQGNSVTFNANLINAGTETIDTAKQNDILVGAIGAVTMYKILRASEYTDPQLFAPVISMAVLSESALRVTWADTTGNIDTEIQVSADGINWGASISLGQDAVQYDITGLTVGTTRYARVRFIGDGVIHITSNWSNIANATTAANLAPTASSVTLTCTPSDWQVGNVLSGSYIYADNESNAQDISATGSTFEIKAYDSVALANADTTNTSGTSVVTGYTGGNSMPQLAYTILVSQVGKYLKLWVKPKAVGGTLEGVWSGSNVGNIIIAAPANKSVVFDDNASKSITFNADSNINFGDGSTDDTAQSYFLRIKPTRITSFNSIFGRGSSGTDAGLKIYLDTDKVTVAFFDNSTTTNFIYAKTTAGVALNTWISICVTYDGSSTSAGLNIYVNGVLAAANKGVIGTYTAMPINGNFAIGKFGSETCAGLVSDVVIINKELTAGEALSLHNLNASLASTLSFAANVKLHARLNGTLTPEVGSYVLTNNGSVAYSLEGAY